MKDYIIESHRVTKPHYKYCIGIGFYDALTSIKSSGQVIQRKNKGKLNKIIQSTYDTLLSKDPELLQNSLHILIDDCSPVPPDDLYAKGLSFIKIKLLKNVGCGHKENLLQSIACMYSDYLIRIDSDVELSTNLSVETERAFQTIPDIGILTINSGYSAYWTLRAQEGDFVPAYSQIGNCTVIPTELFQKISMTNPALRYFEDIDLLRKFEFEGYNSYMSRKIIAKHSASGAGCSLEQRRFQAEKLAAENPLLKFSVRKDGMPVFRKTDWNKLKLSCFDLTRTYIKYGPSPLAQEIQKDLEDNT